MTCSRRCESVNMLRGKLRIEFDVEIQALGFGDVAERAVDVILQVAEAQRRRYRP